MVIPLYVPSDDGGKEFAGKLLVKNRQAKVIDSNGVISFDPVEFERFFDIESYRFNPALKNEGLNLEFVWLDEQGLPVFSRLNWIKRQSWRWMFSDHHFQKHWRLYAGPVVAALMAALVEKWTGLLSKIIKGIANLV